MVSFFKDDGKRQLLFLGLSAVALILSFFSLVSIPVPFSVPILSPGGRIDLSWIAIVLCGYPIVRGAAVGLVTKFDIKADVLVSLALIASLLIGETFAAGEVAFIMMIGSWLEEHTVARARAGIEKLVRLSPSTARVIRGGEEQVVPAREVKIGDLLRVLAGETIAVDGVITSGQTSVDQSVMTGESLPVDKGAGDEVLSGTVNQFGTFDMKAVKVGEDSSLQRMIRLVESADAGKAKIVGMADRWATWVVVVALLSAGITWFVTGEIIRAVTILVVFCPCALVLATPTAIMAGIGNAARYGILISQGDALERLARVERIAFDKTGTLTYGKPAVETIKSCSAAADDAELLRLTAVAESRSEHPLGKAIAAHYKEMYHASPDQPDDFQLLAGRGVRAVTGGQTVLAGSEALLAENGIVIPDALSSDVMQAKEAGAIVICVANGSEALGYIALSDTLRPDARQTVEAIHATGTRTVLLTGDTEQTARHISAEAGITEVKAGCLPEDKLDAIRSWQEQGEQVCMVGDGINDAPALKAALVGIAMGGVGSDIAIEAADIALVRDDIREIPHLISLAGRTMKTIRFNLAASMALNFIAIILAMTGVLNPVVGALVHNAGSVAVIINSSLLLTWRKTKIQG